MSLTFKKFLGATAVGSFLGLITGIMYALSQQDLLGGIGMFFFMLGFTYAAGLLLELLFFFHDWIDR